MRTTLNTTVSGLEHDPQGLVHRFLPGLALAKRELDVGEPDERLAENRALPVIAESLRADIERFAERMRIHRVVLFVRARHDQIDVQPSRRPKDGRYGDNPNRLQHYYQFQVVLKPSPPDIVELYLGSLEAVGLDLAANDVRFVEDDWENPTLGAWGLGWEVWLNGMEITQFTYFQQVGGLDCNPITGEITYGLERLAMYLQDKDNVFDLVWAAESLRKGYSGADNVLVWGASDGNLRAASILTTTG